MDFELTDEQRLIKQTAAEFTDNEISPVAGLNSRNHHFDLDLVAKIAAQGYLGAIIPQEYGGAGLDYVTYGIIGEQIGRGCSGMRMPAGPSQRTARLRAALPTALKRPAVLLECNTSDVSLAVD